MRAHLLAREVCSGVTRLRTPITADNAARRARCNSVPDRMDAELEREPHYGRARQFEGRHATEYMVTVGEFGASEVRDQSVVS